MQAGQQVLFLTALSLPQTVGNEWRPVETQAAECEPARGIYGVEAAICQFQKRVLGRLLTRVPQGLSTGRFRPVV